MPLSDDTWLDVIARISGSGALLLDEQGAPLQAERTALRLLGCESLDALRAAWPALSASVGPQSWSDLELTLSDTKSVRLSNVALEGGPGCRLVLVRPSDAGGAAGESQGKDELLAFARKLGHDLRGPLNAMVLNLDLLRTYLDMDLEESERTPKLHRYSAALQREIGRLNDLLTAAIDRERS